MRHIYNTTYIVEEKAEREWVAFMREKYIRAIADLGVVADMIFTKVSIDQGEGKTYSLQLIFPAEEVLNHFLTYHLERIDRELASAYKDRYLYFSSTLTEI